MNCSRWKALRARRPPDEDQARPGSFPRPEDVCTWSEWVLTPRSLQHSFSALLVGSTAACAPHRAVCVPECGIRWSWAGIGLFLGFFVRKS